MNRQRHFLQRSILLISGLAIMHKVDIISHFFLPSALLGYNRRVNNVPDIRKSPEPFLTIFLYGPAMLFSLALDLPYFRFIEFARNLDRKSFVLFPAQKKTSDFILNNKFNEMVKNDWDFFQREPAASNNTSAKSRNYRKYGEFVL